ncbi:arginine--tRNA ligase [Filimonas effusa]|uniref:Arginine--tRNA ligase n=1 Tax=Filimonas effusa TaxID=2508721 RepID=A0A4Q1D8S2_9BACT|nr:arginine--tRNA ligase [Filimonas effusa]RXK85610.1 arginine--tRNA ligase [Filimonas effusa]
MSVVAVIKEATAKVIEQLYQQETNPESILINATKPEFTGDYTIVLFGFIKQLKQSPEALGNAIGNELVKQYPGHFHSFNIIKGFLNLQLTDSYWLQFLHEQHTNIGFGVASPNNRKVMVEYSSPNTNKPLHLGHLRNNFLGWSIASILNAAGSEVVKTCIVNDRGIHICKSMIAWQLTANGATPESTNKKGDHFVGDYYVKFNDIYKAEVEALLAKGLAKEEAEKEAPIMKAAQQMLVDWEAGKPEVIALWQRMNNWVYQGFDATYKQIGSDFDKTYYESETYLLGKDLVESGLQKGVFFKKEDGSVWIDLTADGLDQKLVQRKDGTAVYMTQDIGLAVRKYEEYKCDESIYVVGDEQNYHFKVLKLIAQKLGLPAANGIYHLSYGMVELPTGKMKSREGTVVDADDLVAEMISTAAKETEQLGKVQNFSDDEKAKLNETIALSALKFFLLRVDPRKKMIFNPEESIDSHGFTGPFIQYTYARIKSILRKEQITGTGQWDLNNKDSHTMLPLEKELATQLEQFPSVIQEAAAEHDPSKIAIFVFNVSKTFSSLYAAHSIGNAETEEKKTLRLQLAQLTSIVIKRSMKLLGIEVPEQM